MNPRSRIRNPGALRWLVMIIGCLTFACWMLWRPHALDATPPVLPFIAIVIAAAILFDRC
jgi:hypothetical protein